MAMNPREFRQVFKVVTRTDWERARATGTLAASKDDERDGFIHLSAAHQLAGTLAKHFKAQTDLVLIEFDAAALGETLRWEPSRGNDLFPHQYGPLQTSAVRSVLPLQLGADGAHILPQSLCKC
jgi:uncharacterized protein (DUF952 family)